MLQFLYVSFANSPFTTTNTTIIRSSCPVVFCRKCENVFLQILQNSQENTCARASFVRHSHFLVNFPKFLITPFLRNPSDGYFCISTHHNLLSFMSHAFSGIVFSQLNLLTGNKRELNISNLLPEPRNLFSTQSNICDGAFFTANSLKRFSIFAKKKSFIEEV